LALFGLSDSALKLINSWLSLFSLSPPPSALWPHLTAADRTLVSALLALFYSSSLLTRRGDN
jgi:hypothetical protein